MLVGTRGLLGEGWDARAITGLVDLTTVDHQHLRRADPRPGAAHRPVLAGEGRADLVASSASPTSTPRAATTGTGWSASTRATSASTPRARWSTASRTSTPTFSPYVAAAGRGVRRGERPRDASRSRAARHDPRASGRSGQPYVDTAVYGIRIKERGVAGLVRLRARRRSRADVVLRPDAAELRGIRRTAPATGPPRLLAGAGVLAALVAGVAGAPAGAGRGSAGRSGAAAYARVRSHLRHGEELLHGAEEAPSVIRIASAVADGLLRRRAGPPRRRLGRGGAGRRGRVPLCPPRRRRGRGRGLRDRPRRGGVADQPAALPAATLGADQARTSPGGGPLWAGFGRLKPDGVVWHAVPYRPRRQRRAGCGVRQGLGPLGRRRRARLHRARPRGRASWPPSRAPTRSPPAR